jgi:hypothetical protein
MPTESRPLPRWNENTKKLIELIIADFKFKGARGQGGAGVGSCNRGGAGVGSCNSNYAGSFAPCAIGDVGAPLNWRIHPRGTSQF